MITVKQLRHLLAIIEQGTIHSAADSLCLTHTAVTRSLNNLEDYLGVPLFERSKAGMRPTAFCQQIVDACRDVLLDIGDIKREADIYRNLFSGVLNIAVGRAVSSLILRKTLPEFHKRYPHINVRVTENTPRQLVEGLHNRELDILIAGSGSYSEEVGLSIQPLKDLPMGLVVRSGHPLIDEIKSNVHELVKYPLVAPTLINQSHPIYKSVVSKLEGVEDIVDSWPSIMCSDYPAMADILLNTDAWGIAPVEEFSKLLENGDLYQISFGDNSMATALSVIEVSNRMRSPAAQAFVAICEEHFSEP